MYLSISISSTIFFVSPFIIILISLLRSINSLLNNFNILFSLSILYFKVIISEWKFFSS